MAQAGRMGRKFPIGIDKAVDDFIREMKLFQIFLSDFLFFPSVGYPVSNR